MNRFLGRTLTAAIPLLLIACSGGGEDAEVAQVAEAPADTAGMGGMQGMPGMAGGGMMDEMQNHMEMMAAAPADSVAAMMPQHRQMAANMLAQMNRDMQQMDMAGDSAWSATADSIRQDLTRMPDLRPEEMESFMAGHHARMTRLMNSHRAMMGGTRM